MSASELRQGKKNSASGRGRSKLTATSGTTDYSLIAVLATILAFGLVMVYSATATRAGTDYFVRQLLWVSLGIVALAVSMRLPYTFWQRMAIPIMAFTLLALAAVLLFGERLLGSQRTLLSGSIQPSEFAKIAVAVYVAAWVAAKGEELRKAQAGLIPFSILMGLVTSLIVMEPSFSVAIIVLTIGITIFFVGGGDIKQLLIAGCIGAIVLALLLWRTPYAVDRIEEWWTLLVRPEQAPWDLVRFREMVRNSGGIFSDPALWGQKRYIPLLWSDYLFLNVGLDLRLPGMIAVVALYALLGYRCLAIALNAPDRFAALLAIGITTWFMVQAVVHVGTALALIPQTGQPLPFMSYGGSAMLSGMTAMGILLSIARSSTEKKGVYESVVVGGRNRRARLPDPGSGERPAAKAPDGRPRRTPRRRASFAFRLQTRLGRSPAMRTASRKTATAGRSTSGTTSAGKRTKPRSR